MKKRERREKKKWRRNKKRKKRGEWPAWERSKVWLDKDQWIPALYFFYKFAIELGFQLLENISNMFSIFTTITQILEFWVMKTSLKKSSQTKVLLWIPQIWVIGDEISYITQFSPNLNNPTILFFCWRFLRKALLALVFCFAIFFSSFHNIVMLLHINYLYNNFIFYF